MGSLGAWLLLHVMLCNEEGAPGHAGLTRTGDKRVGFGLWSALFCPALKRQLLTLTQPAVQPAPNVPKSACTSDPVACPSAPAVDLC